ncbi:hypothetical protein TSMEX_000315 [Taenia solium]|eukprot:TsM_001004800 transcript=TsM_001004800 gene=TsM_001004800
MNIINSTSVEATDEVIMAGSPIRAPLPNLLFPQSGEKSPLITGSGVRNSSPILSDIVTGSPTYSRFPEGPFCPNNVGSASPQPPAKKRCLEPQQQSNSGEGEGLAAPSQPTHECSSDSPHTSASSFSPKGSFDFTKPERTCVRTELFSSNH